LSNSLSFASLFSLFILLLAFSKAEPIIEFGVAVFKLFCRIF